MRAKITHTVLLLICFVGPASVRAQQTPPSAGENWETLEKIRFGQKTEVYLKDGSKIEGSKFYSDDSKLTLYSEKKTLVINREQVAQVFIEIANESPKESAFGNAVAGGLAGALVASGATGERPRRGRCFIAYTALSAVVGALRRTRAPDKDYEMMLIYEAKE